MKILKPRLPTNYADCTYESPHLLIRYAHRRRFRKVIDVVNRFRPASVLDYGAGDGFLFKQMAEAGGHFPARVVAYDPLEYMVEALKANTARLPSAVEPVIDFAELPDERFDMIVCLEVLEHMPLLERYKFYELCRTRLSPEGVCLIDVPVEVGPSLLVKNFGRVVLKGREREYGWKELMSIAAGRCVFDQARFDPTDESTWITMHKGFDYRLFEKEVERIFDVVERFATPLRALPPWSGNQEVYFLIRNQAGT